MVIHLLLGAAIGALVGVLLGSLWKGVLIGAAIAGGIHWLRGRASQAGSLE
jgi:ABC-type uncharacterized transport system permease subunit